MTKLYEISEGKDGAQIIELKIIKESDKTYIVTNKYTSRHIRKSTLPVHWLAFGNYLITNDLEAGKKEWNNRIKQDIGKSEVKLNKLKSMLISE